MSKSRNLPVRLCRNDKTKSGVSRRSLIKSGLAAGALAGVGTIAAHAHA
jgi:hypothetical protein